MTVLTCTNTGQSITLLRELVSSGEAKIWRTSYSGHLAKIYHSPTLERIEKLAVMIAHPPQEPNAHLQHISLAWPKSILKNAQGECVGFLMPEIKGGRELLDVYNPQRYQRQKLEVNWQFLHITAQNIASIIEAIHAAGYVLGDIKPQNILVNNQALPSIIDTDSFQVRNPKNGKIYRCLVGSEGYTPPELIGQDFSQVEQTEVHDRFRLAVIIYQLLFGGQTPFQGKWVGPGESPEPSELVRQGIWLYGTNSLIQPVDRTIPLAIVALEIQQCFLRCLNDGHRVPNSRPSAQEWVKALKGAVQKLTLCGKVNSHFYSQTYGICYWCDRSSKLGVDIFPPKVVSILTPVPTPQPRVAADHQVLTCTNTGQSITLLRELVSSGEAKIWQTSYSGHLAKIYHTPTPERIEKLAVMIAHPPQEPNAHLQHISFAWPKSILKNAQGDCVGFLMLEIKGGRELLDVYNPQRYQRQKLEINWQFLHTTAQNIASIIEVIHAAGYVLGDIKPQNILVNNQALPSIIDTDSFQVRNTKNGKIYRCLVGSVGYTPPELIGKDFAQVEQTELHDRFRLAVIIYQLLFGGQTPFQGKWVGPGTPPQPSELVSQGLWLHGTNSLIRPVENTIPLAIVAPELRQCFLRCFNNGHRVPSLRPSAQEWVKALKKAMVRLAVCGKVDTHYYSRTYGKCYWCDRSSQLGVDIFPPKVVSTPTQVSPPQAVPLRPKVTVQKSIIQLITFGLLAWINSKLGLFPYSSYVNNPTTTHIAPITYQPYNPITAPIPPVTPPASNPFIPPVTPRVATANLVNTLTGHSSSVESVAISRDGSTLVSGSDDHTIKIWNLETGELKSTLTGHSGTVTSVAIGPNGKTVVSVSDDNTIKVWNLVTGVLISNVIHSGVESIAISPEGNTLVTVNYDDTIKIWERTGALRFTLTPSRVECIAISPDSSTLVSGGDDGTIKVWNLATGELKSTLISNSGSVRSVAISSDSGTLVSGGGDGTIKVWNLVTGELKFTLTGHSGSVMSLVISPDGNTLVSGGWDGTIKVWNLVTGELKFTLTGHSHWVNSVAISPDGNTIVSGSGDGTIKIWRLQ
jgi:DNA-binding helix-hairpin-helix protein with protein kinase domain